MEEVPVDDCPPTPEILPLSVTPPRPEVVYSSSSEEAEETADGRRSPPPKCAICLGKCRQPAFANSCKHQFCFRCLLEWSKVKPECPLCKQRFLSIVYYKSIDCFEQHTIPVPTANEARARNRETYHELNLFLSNSPRFAAYSIPSNMTLRLQSNNDRLQELLLHQSSEVDRFIREYGNQPIPSRQDQLRWRQFVYSNRLYACPMPDLNGRFRDTSAAFYRENPAQMHRVLSYMHRDLLVLGVNIAVHAPNMNVLEDLLQTHDIDSREFLLRILRHMPLETGEHFQHECTNFARSPYDMIGYDRCVQYNPRYYQPRRVRSGEVIISSSEEDNDDIVYLPEPSASTSSTNEPSNGVAAAGEGGAGNGANGGSSSSGTASTNQRTGRTADVHIEFRSLVDSAGNEELHPVVVSATQPQQQQQQGVNVLPRVPLTSTAASSAVPTENILLSSSDSDDCQFVLAQKPPHLRTPDHVVDLESASDSDVVFVAEEPLGEAGPTARGTRQQLVNLMKKETANQDYNNGASTSSGYCGGGGAGGACGVGGNEGTGGSSGSVASGSAALRTKYYARPRLTRYSGGIGVKSIYEASDSDDSDCDSLFNLPPGRRAISGKAKPRRSKAKKKSSTVESVGAKGAGAKSKAKSKSSKSRSASARSGGRSKKRTKPASENEQTRSTPLLEEGASTGAHYVIASRPSVSPTIDVTTVDGAECRERKLKSVIIKRCHYIKSSSGGRTNDAMVVDEEPATGSGASGPGGEEAPTSSRLTVEEETNADMKQEEPLKCEPTDDNDIQLSSTSGSSTDSEPEVPVSSGWNSSRFSSVIAVPAPTCSSSVSFNPTLTSAVHPQQHWPLQDPGQQYMQAQLQLPTAGNDQHHQPPCSLLEVDESNTGASESIFEPTLSWAESDTNHHQHQQQQHRPLLLPEDRALSSAAASPFSSISFPPSTTSVSPSPSLSSQSLALPASVASPLELIESMGTMDSDSPLPSSVLGLDAIDGTMDEIMATEEVVSSGGGVIDGVDAAIALPAIAVEVLEGVGVQDPASVVPCVLETSPPAAAADGGSAGVQLQL
uniref:RING-type E3 ubiquitin transferase n=1 Tax=Anopheles melas TaxID=34690 RepID=A0A182TIJ5_9DIPT